MVRRNRFRRGIDGTSERWNLDFGAVQCPHSTTPEYLLALHDGIGGIAGMAGNDVEVLPVHWSATRHPCGVT